MKIEIIENQKNTIGHCRLPKVPPRVFSPEVHLRRVGLIRVLSSYWTNGTRITYGFLQKTSGQELDVVRKAFADWQGLCGLTFQEVADATQAMVRITFDRQDGSWSYVGRDILDPSIVGKGDPTMNFGWDLSANSYGVTTALHEIGHTLGFPHEHQNPISGIVWNEQAVLDSFSGPPNHWEPEMIQWNILRKLDKSEVGGSRWDKDSIMHYQFDAGLIQEPAEYLRKPLIPPGVISPADKAWVQQFYPPTKPADTQLALLQSQKLALSPGMQADFLFVPDYSRVYTIQTYGASDVVMVLNVKGDKDQWRYLAADDDSGEDRNAKIQRRLLAGNTYQIRVRLYYSDRSGETAIMVS
ncbi:MAG: M12 family metallopeptidase [Magnetococcus sp. MYC-9]